MSNSPPTFVTSDVGLAAFLMLSGLKFIESIQETRPENANQKPRVKMRFFDEKSQALDLEKVWMGSQIKQYEDYRKYLLRDIHRTLKGSFS